MTAMTPLQFGSAPNRLYGVLHASPGAAYGDRGVVIAPSVGHEYIRSHRALVQLAVELERSGVPTLRFDWSGVGDSEGELENCGLDRWISDLGIAIRELQGRVGTRKVVVIGQHWGAVIAVMAAAGRGDVDSLVLQDAVLDGRSAIDEMHAVQEHVERSTTARFKDAVHSGGAVELVGAVWSEPQLNAMARLALINTARKPASRVLFAESGAERDLSALITRFDALGAKSTTIKHPLASHLREDPFKPRVPLAMIKDVVRWVAT